LTTSIEQLWQYYPQCGRQARGFDDASLWFPNSAGNIIIASLLPYRWDEIIAIDRWMGWDEQMIIIRQAGVLLEKVELNSTSILSRASPLGGLDSLELISDCKLGSETAL
jgi:hypothetical protein